MTTLIVTLPAQPGPAAEHEYLLTPDGQALGGHASVAPALLPKPTGAGTEIVAVVPAGALSWHRIELPQGIGPRSPRLRAVLEGLLEDRLLDEPDTLHFALQPHAHAGQAAWVAVCDRAWLRDSLAVLEAAERPVARVVPEFAPGDPPALYVTGEPHRATVVATGEHGVFIAPLSAGVVPLLPALPETATCLAEPGVAAVAEQLLQRPFALQQAPQRRMAAARLDWDLAQFDLASSSRSRAFKRAAATGMDLLQAPQWRPARWGAALLVAANLLGLNAWAWKERTALDTKRETIRATLTQTFPAVKVVVDAPVQMDKEVAALRQATGASSNRDLEAMLSALGAAVPPQRQAGGVEYVNGELRVRGLALGGEDAPGVMAALRAQGYVSRQEGDVLAIRPGGVR